MVDIMEIARPHFSTLVRCQLFAIYRDLLPIFSFHPRSLSFTIVHNRVQKLIDSYTNDELFHQCRNYKMVKRAHHITRLSPFWVESCTLDGIKTLISEISPRHNLFAFLDPFSSYSFLYFSLFSLILTSPCLLFSFLSPYFLRFFLHFSFPLYFLINFSGSCRECDLDNFDKDVLIKCCFSLIFCKKTFINIY